jgi:ABC-2 type transport system ATP-binding protein
MPDDKAMAVDVMDLEKRYGSFVAVNRISFQVRRGEIFGFLGANGAGKSTTIRMLCGIITPTGGSGQVAGYDIVRESESIKQRIGYMSQKFSLYQDLTVSENIDFYLGIYGVPRGLREERKEWALGMAQLQEQREEITGSLPTGYRQRLALGCALLHRPEIVFLDEPTSGVDPITRRGFWDFTRQLAAQGTTIFVTTHYMDEAENCGRIALIFSGRILACDTPAGLKQAIAGDLPKPTLQDVFVRLMKSGAEPQQAVTS